MKTESTAASPRGDTKHATPSRNKNTKKMYFHRLHDRADVLVPRRYDSDFAVSDEYRASLPDMTEAFEAIEGANVVIQQVGVSGFKLPLRFRTESGETLTLEARITGTVSLNANLKGINMSRIVRSFYDHKDDVFTLETLADILRRYQEKVGGLSARLRVQFSFPMVQRSLRSNLEGYQFYDVAFEAALSASGLVRKFVSFDFVYSSACPCSAELAEHARDYRGQFAIPHSQRSRARIKVEVAENETLTVEDLQRHCLTALKTETQVMVKREDEQAFAEMNGVYIKFVEDAARLLYQELNSDARITDFEAACSHLESLHSHDAVSVICKGVAGGFTADFTDFESLAG